MANPDDEADIPADAAVYSKNLDPMVDGALAGVPDDKYLKLSGFASSVSTLDYTQGDSSAGSGGDYPS